MNKARFVLTSTIFSPEFLVILLGSIFYILLGKRIDVFLQKVMLPGEIVKWLALTPSLVLGWILYSGKRLIFPEKHTDIFCKWEDHWKVDLLFRIAIFYAAFFTIIGVVAWCFPWAPPNSKAICCMAIALFGSAATFYTVYDATIAVEKILRTQL